MQEKKQKISMILNENKKKQAVVADVTSVGRRFHKRLPATGKARSPTVTSLVAGTTTKLNVGEEERSRRRFTSDTRCKSSHRYGGAMPCRHRQTVTASLYLIMYSGSPT